MAAGYPHWEHDLIEGKNGGGNGGRVGNQNDVRSRRRTKNGVGAAFGLGSKENELVLPVEGPGPASSTDGVGLGVSLTAVREESRAEGGGKAREEGREGKVKGEVEDLGLRFD